MNQKITSAGRLLAETRKINTALVAGGDRQVHQVLKDHFGQGGSVAWQFGVVRFEKLVIKAQDDLDLFTSERSDKYRNTLDNVKRVVSSSYYSHGSASFVPQILTELVFERMENFHENLILAGRFFSVEQERLDEAIASITDLIFEIENGDRTEIDDAVVEYLKQLREALNKYDLYGPEGVEDHVSYLIGSSYIKVLGLEASLSEEVKKRIGKVLVVSKAVMDVFVYAATIGQSVEWSGQVTKLLQSS